MRVSIENVWKRFGPITALQGVSLELASGERVAILGPSGSGKTTLLRLIAGLEKPGTGRVMVGSEEAESASQDVAMVFQSLALFPHLSAFENMALGLRIRKIPREEIRQRVNETAELLRIGSLLDRKPERLSAGERQRVALARAVVKRPRVLLLDEPLANLDAHLRAELREELNRVHERFGMTLVAVTHDLIEALILGERIAVLNQGRLEQFDSADRLLENPASAFVKSFLMLPKVPEIARHFLKLSGCEEVER